MIENYRTVNRTYGPRELKEKGSRFISYLYPVSKKEEADNVIAKLRKEFYDSTHVCFSYRLGEGMEEYFRYNDDGEPSGTAGHPIYQEIVRKELFNVLVAVVRYYGGVKLGTGGLQRAYSSSARSVLDSAGIIKVEIKKEFSLSIPFTFIGDIMHIVNLFAINIEKQDYTAEGVNMILSVPLGKVDLFQKLLTEKSGGKIKAS